MRDLQAASESDLTYLDIKSLQTVIQYKWDAYTKGFFKIQFIVFNIFIILFFVDLLLNSSYGLEKESRQLFIANIVVRIISGLIILYLTIFELMQLFARGIVHYVSSIWNLTDGTLYLTYFSYIIVIFLEVDFYAVQCLKCAIVLFAFIKLSFFLRIFSNFSFLVHMI